MTLAAVTARTELTGLTVDVAYYWSEENWTHGQTIPDVIWHLDGITHAIPEFTVAEAPVARMVTGQRFGDIVVFPDQAHRLVDGQFYIPAVADTWDFAAVPATAESFAEIFSEFQTRTHDAESAREVVTSAISVFAVIDGALWIAVAEPEYEVVEENGPQGPSVRLHVVESNTERAGQRFAAANFGDAYAAASSAGCELIDDGRRIHIL